MLMLTGAAVMQLHPAVEHDRFFVPEEVYVGKDCGCDCISQSLPWYSTFNYWSWIWVLAVPIFVFSVRPNAATWKKIAATLIAIAFCYAVLNLARHLFWDIRNGPFWSHAHIPGQKPAGLGLGCTDVTGGPSVTFTHRFGWIKATIYTGWWQMIWFQYHRRITGLIEKDYKRDRLNKTVVRFSVIIPILGILGYLVAGSVIAVRLFFEPEWLLKSIEWLQDIFTTLHNQ